MKAKQIVALVIVGAALCGICINIGDAVISSILTGGKVSVTELSGNVQYTSNPFTDWTSILNIQAGAVWNCRITDLTIDYTGDINLTWTLYGCGPDGLVGTGDDYAVPGATLLQTVSMTANVPANITSSSDGFNAYNWGQYTTSPVEVYVQTEVTEG